MGIKTRKHIDYVVKKALELKRYNITPIMVFDGEKLGSKSKTEDDREKNRIENRKKADEYFEMQ